MNEQNHSPVADPTIGPAVFTQAQDLLLAGGPVVAILLAMSVVALAIMLVKLVQFSRIRIGERRFVDAALTQYRNGNVSEARTILTAAHNPIAHVMDVALRGRMRADISELTVREEITRVAADELQNLRSYLRGLEVIATLSPLLGLLGTVLGMINAFQQLEQAGNQINPAILSGGIWEALLTTAVGLGVAIPVVAVLNWLERNVDRLAHDMESAVTRIFTLELAHPQSQNATPYPHSARLQAEG